MRRLIGFCWAMRKRWFILFDAWRTFFFEWNGGHFTSDYGSPLFCIRISRRLFSSSLLLAFPPASPPHTPTRSYVSNPWTWLLCTPFFFFLSRLQNAVSSRTFLALIMTGTVSHLTRFFFSVLSRSFSIFGLCSTFSLAFIQYYYTRYITYTINPMHFANVWIL